MSILASTSSASTAAGWGGMIIWLVVLFGFHVLFHDPSAAERSKEEKKMQCCPNLQSVIPY